MQTVMQCLHAVFSWAEVHTLTKECHAGKQLLPSPAGGNGRHPCLFTVPSLMACSMVSLKRWESRLFSLHICHSNTCSARYIVVF